MKPKGLHPSIKRAKEIWDKKEQIARLYAKANQKSKKDKKQFDSGFIADLKSIQELIKASLNGAFKFSKKTMIYIVAALLYFINPFDLIPDFILGLGFLDDAAVLAFVLRSVRSEIKRYKKAMDFQELELVS